MPPIPLQLQNSKAVIQSKDSTIQELQEKIAYLEAEVCAPGRERALAVAGEAGGTPRASPGREQALAVGA